MPGLASLRPRALTLWAAALSVLALAGCTSQPNAAVSVTGKSLMIYGSGPPGAAGAGATDVLEAEQLAFKQSGGQAGRYKVGFQILHGSELSQNARTAVQDQSAIAYLGEIVPGTSPVSLEINNELDLLQVSPTDTADYLTQANPAVSGAPSRYYPAESSYHETFARMVPTTVQEAAAIVAELQSLHLNRLYLADDDQPYGVSVAFQVRQDAAKAGLTLTSSAQGADAVFYGSNSPAKAAQQLQQDATTAPGAKLFVPSALYESSFVAGLGASVQSRLYVSSPGFTRATLTPAGRQFESRFQAAYGHTPVPQAIFGYEAMSAVLAVIREAGSHAGDRSTIVADFRALKDRQSVLGTYSLHAGDTTLAPFVFARARAGTLVPIK